MDISIRNSSSMESSTSRRQHLCSQARSFVVGHEWSRHVSHLLETRPAKRSHKEYAVNLVAGQMNGARSVAGYVQCRFRHRAGSRPVKWLVFWNSSGRRILTLIALCRALAISLSLSSRGLLPKISGSQNWPTAPFMCCIFPKDGGGALTH